MRQRNYSTPEEKTRFFVGQSEFILCVTDGYNPDEKPMRQYWISYHVENCFKWETVTLIEGATIVGEAIRDTVLSDNQLFLHRLRDDTLLMCSHYNRRTVVEYFAIGVDKNGDTHYGIYNGEDGSFTVIFDVLSELVRSKTQQKKEN